MPYEAHPSAGELPHDNTIIWRFMNLAKFLSAISTSSLYFSQGSVLRTIDPYEGSRPLKNLLFFQLMSSNERFAKAFLKIPDTEKLPENFMEVFSVETHKKLGAIFSSTTYINCWHMSEHESAFLWSVYASISDGICIKSNVARLKKSLELEKRPIYIGPVQYIDYQIDGIDGGNMLNPFFKKRKSFESEKELRACFMELLPDIGWSERALTENPQGIYMPCDLPALVDEVFVSPSAPEWYADAVSASLVKFGYNFPVRKSSLASPAIF